MITQTVGLDCEAEPSARERQAPGALGFERSKAYAIRTFEQPRYRPLRMTFTMHGIETFLDSNAE